MQSLYMVLLHHKHTLGIQRSLHDMAYVVVPNAKWYIYVQINLLSKIHFIFKYLQFSTEICSSFMFLWLPFWWKNNMVWTFQHWDVLSKENCQKSPGRPWIPKANCRPVWRNARTPWSWTMIFQAGSRFGKRCFFPRRVNISCPPLPDSWWLEDDLFLFLFLGRLGLSSGVHLLFVLSWECGQHKKSQKVATALA